MSGWLSLLLGLPALAVLPAAVAVSDRTDRYSLLEAGFAVAPAAVLALAAIGLAGRARRRQRAAVGRVRGLRAAQIGRLLGWLGFYLAATGALALGVYWLETYLAE
ncbi:MAG: hypothetical protein ICV59_07915 [Thermoleophilia bacterium]|nr:hypothetical protein [Thermoleophilia bacterium]